MNIDVNTAEQQIREYAYQIWLTEGSPQGQAQRHWEMARQLAEAEAMASRAAQPGVRPPPASKARSTTALVKTAATKVNKTQGTGKVDT